VLGRNLGRCGSDTIYVIYQLDIGCIGGESGIRTHGRLAPSEVFKTSALNHSATSPDQKLARGWHAGRFLGSMQRWIK
jgi:hypothetical protein